jgi:8-oxo-dGTP diphosphatase
MERKESIARVLEKAEEFLPGISVDCVIFGFHDHQLKVLLARFKNTELWALPGGYVRIEEDLEDAARRILKARTALRDIYLEQFYAFGQCGRVDSRVQREITAAVGVALSPDAWISRRFVSVGYYALVDFSEVTLAPGDSSDACDWYNLDTMPDLVFDHTFIVKKALETLRLRLDDILVSSNLLPEIFTMRELQSLHETVYGKKLLRANFQRKMLGMGILERMEKKFSGRAHKAPFLYRFGQALESDIFEE